MSETLINNPFIDLLGVQIEHWEDGYVRARLNLQADHQNRSGVIHGGILTTLLDHVGSFSGLYCTTPGHARFCVTLSLTCNFVGQSKSGSIVAAGRRTAGGRNIYFAQSEILDLAGSVLATGTSVHRYRKGSENPQGVPVNLSGPTLSS
jgi:uncharacterized protein (TIGR00369 family)